MKTLHLAIIAIILYAIFPLDNVSGLEADSTNTTQGQTNVIENNGRQILPIEISRVELNDSYQSISPGISCQQWNAMADQRLVPYYCTQVAPRQEVECGYSMVYPRLCVPVHVTYNFTDACPFYSEFLPDGSPVIEKFSRGTQWFVLYNPHPAPASVANFSLDWYSKGFQEHNFDNFSLTLLPHERCTVAGQFAPSDNVTLQVQYDYQGSHFLVKTPQLTDDFHDSRIWALNGTSWSLAAPAPAANSNQPALSPLSQTRYGIDPRHVRCQQGLQLVFKAEDGSPACVLPQDVGPLYLRGWSGGPFPQNVVFVIKPHSSGQILVKFANTSPETDLVLYPKLYDGFTKNQLDSSQLILDETPITIPHDETRIITYNLVAKNTSGMYWLKVAPCRFIPIYVEGFNSKIHYQSDIQDFLAVYHCPSSGVQYHIVATIGIGTKFVPYGS
ncbi:MAG: hypothetical protein KGI33_11645 [Thaumarchaeota archaeon]|nr:hypothetical protein [Nitrososphaerota archaeon]